MARCCQRWGVRRRNVLQGSNGTGMALTFAYCIRVLVRPGETVRVRTRFSDFAGKSVYHCHILDHEELGMMGNILIEA